MNCIWKDRCGCECTAKCEDYTPLDDMELALEEYEADLEERVAAYEAILTEQGGD